MSGVLLLDNTMPSYCFRVLLHVWVASLTLHTYQQLCDDDQSISPQDENKNNLLVRDDSQSQIRRSRSTSTPSMPLDDSTISVSGDLLNPPPLLFHDPVNIDSPHESLLTANSNHNTLGVQPQHPAENSSNKVSWRRRLSVKVGLSTKSKNPANSKSYTAVPENSNSLGFFSDQQTTPAPASKWSRLKPGKV